MADGGGLGARPHCWLSVADGTEALEGRQTSIFCLCISAWKPKVARPCLAVTTRPVSWHRSWKASGSNE